MAYAIQSRIADGWDEARAQDLSGRYHLGRRSLQVLGVRMCTALSRAGTLAHLPDYGLPDMGTVLQGLPASAHDLMNDIVGTLRRYEPRLAEVRIGLLPQRRPGHLEYALDVHIKGGSRATFGTTLAPDGRVVVRHLKQQGYLTKP